MSDYNAYDVKRWREIIGVEYDDISDLDLKRFSMIEKAAQARIERIIKGCLFWGRANLLAAIRGGEDA